MVENSCNFHTVHSENVFWQPCFLKKFDGKRPAAAATFTFFRGPLALPSPEDEDVVDDRRADERDLFFKEALVGSFLATSLTGAGGGTRIFAGGATGETAGGGGEISFSSLSSITNTTPSSVSELLCLLLLLTIGASLMVVLVSSLLCNVKR